MRGEEVERGLSVGLPRLGLVPRLLEPRDEPEHVAVARYDRAQMGASVRPGVEADLASEVAEVMAGALRLVRLLDEAQLHHPQPACLERPPAALLDELVLVMAY